MSGVVAWSDTALYNFVPTFSTCVIFVTLYSVSALLHLAQAIHYRVWWLLPTVFTGAVLEIMGWGFRLWSSKQPRLLDPFLGNLICLGLAPVMVLGGCYLILGLVINSLGPQYSRLRPRTYALFFCSADISCLSIQSIGGALSSTAAQSIPMGDPNLGAKIMLAGIVVQEAFMIVYVCLGTEFVYRWIRNRPLRPAAVDPIPPSASAQPAALATLGSPVTTNEKRDDDSVSSTQDAKKWKLVVFGLSVTTLFIFVRSLYRTAELSQGWTGPIISNQTLFNVLDGTMMILALATLNVLHPGRLLQTRTNKVSLGMRRRKVESEEGEA